MEIPKSIWEIIIFHVSTNTNDHKTVCELYVNHKNRMIHDVITNKYSNTVIKNYKDDVICLGKIYINIVPLMKNNYFMKHNYSSKSLKKFFILYRIMKHLILESNDIILYKIIFEKEDYLEWISRMITFSDIIKKGTDHFFKMSDIYF